MTSIKIQIQTLAEAAQGKVLFAELCNRKIVNGTPITFGILEGGMQSGKASVGMHVELEDGSLVFFQLSGDTTLALADALKGANQRFAVARGGRG